MDWNLVIFTPAQSLLKVGFNMANVCYSDASFPEIPRILDILIFQKISLESLDFLFFSYCNTSGPRNKKNPEKSASFRNNLSFDHGQRRLGIPMQGVHMIGGLS